MMGEDSHIKVVEREAHSIWSDTEVKQAELQHINLVSDYVTAHNRLYLREVDQIGYLGFPGIAGSTGLLNHPGFASSVATGAVGTLTSLQMYNDVAGLVIAQHNAVNNTPEYMAVRVDMPIHVLNTLNVTILSTTNGSASVLNALRANFPGVEFRGTFRADNAGGTGVSHTVAYAINSAADSARNRDDHPNGVV